jgi:hypothetical protein
VSDALADEIARLPMLTRDQLRAKWRTALKQPAPPHLRKQLLVPMLAYKLQEQAYGGLKPQVKRRLRELAVRFVADPKQGAAKLAAPSKMKPGTRFIRQWKGESHHVTVSEDGFDYQGQVYRSLSEIARQITGTRWSGPLFFGLKGNEKHRMRP